MIGISAIGKESISKVVEKIFDRIALQFIGDIPSLRNKKRLIISSEPNFGLSHLFIQAMENKVPNHIEKDVLKSLLESSNGYIESLKSKTMSNVTERIDGLAREAQIQKRKITEEEIEEVLEEELGKARTHMATIIESESSKLRNLGTMMNISRIAATIDDDDPTVFFLVIKDQETCKECKRLHLMPDEVTPRLYKFSELRQGYHKRGDDAPSAFGLHPHCRCPLSYLVKGYGFDEKGKIKFTALGFDAYSIQKEE